MTTQQSLALDAAGIGAISAWLFLAGLVSGFIGALIGSFKNRKTLGLFLGMMFGPLGWLLLLFAQDGERDEGFHDLFIALAMAGALNLLMVTTAWRLVIRPMIDRQQRADQAAEKERAARVAREQARAEEQLRDRENEAAQAEFDALPKSDVFGRPLNRVPPPNLKETPGAPIPVSIPRATPDPAAMAAARRAAELETIRQKYGAR